MPSNPKRLVVKTGFTADGAIEYKYFETGSLSFRFFDAPLTKTGADITFARINGLLSTSAKSAIPKLIELVSQVAHAKMNETIEYSDSLYLDILKHVLANKKLSPELCWATLAATVADSRGVKPEDTVALAMECEHMLEEAATNNRSRYLFRPDLGYYSSREKEKAGSIEVLRDRRSRIFELLESPIYEAANKRREAGVVAASQEINPGSTARYWGNDKSFFGAAVVLTVDEINQFKALLTKNRSRDQTLDYDVSLALGYVYLRLGSERAEEALQFLFRHHSPGYEYSAGTVRFDTVSLHQEPVTLDSFIRVIESTVDDPDTPLEWLMELEL